ncbi:MAG: hypothetical protein H0X30_02490 [Anaerolineae bacterium]|nr:hypothetical protein [Anaerolineae bacterium]
MSNPIKMPTYDELVGLSNGELSKHIQLALKQLIKYEELCDSLTQTRRVYEAYNRERQKRLLVGKRGINPYY